GSVSHKVTKHANCCVFVVKYIFKKSWLIKSFYFSDNKKQQSKWHNKNTKMINKRIKNHIQQNIMEIWKWFIINSLTYFINPHPIEKCFSKRKCYKINNYIVEIENIFY